VSPCNQCIGEHEVFVETYGQVFKIKCILLCKQISMWENHGSKLILKEFQDTRNSKERSQEIPSPEMIWVSWEEIHSITWILKSNVNICGKLIWSVFFLYQGGNMMPSFDFCMFVCFWIVEVHAWTSSGLFICLLLSGEKTIAMWSVPQALHGQR